MKAQESKLQKLIEGTNQYLVPLFQRPYTWTRKEWDQLWTDIVDLGETTEGEHFIGPIVTAPAKSVPEGVAKYVLIDGQQRLTTLFILLAAMRDQANALKMPTLGPEIDNTLLRNAYKQGHDHFKLLPTQGDRPSFIALINSEGAKGEDAIAKCYRFFAQKLKTFDAEALEQCKSVVVTRLVLVSVVLDESDNPHVVFESLNSKGRDLTQADLIRNYFLMRVHVTEQERVFEKLWMPIQSRLGEGTTEFIRHYLMMRGSHVGKNAVYWGLKQEADKERSQLQVEAYLARLEKFARYYHAIIAPDVAETNDQLALRFDRLRRVEVTVAYPLIMALYDRYAGGLLPHSAFTQVLDMIENFMLRRWVCARATGELARFFPGVFVAASSCENLVEGVRRTLSARRYPRDAEFFDRLCDRRLYDGDARVKLFLERLEEFHGHKEQASFSNLTVEHILPQTLTDSWRTMLGSDAETDHEDWLHTLGNLTLTAYNSELSNSDFQKKKKLFAESHVQLNRYFLDVEVWDRDAIEQRARVLAKRALEVWPNFAGDEAEVSRAPGDVTGKKPRALSIAGKAVRVNTWVDVLRETLRVLVELDEELPQRLSTTFPHWCGVRQAEVRTPIQIGPDLYFQGHGSAPALEKRCRDVLRESGLEVEWQVETA